MARVRPSIKNNLLYLDHPSELRTLVGVWPSSAANPTPTPTTAGTCPNTYRGADAVCAHFFFPRNPLRTTSLKTMFRPPSNCCRWSKSPVISRYGARWRHREAVQDALGGTLRTFLGARNGSPPLLLPHLALLGRNPGPTPPDQPPPPPNADRGGTARALTQQRGMFPSAGLRLCSPRRWDPSLPRHGAS